MLSHLNKTIGERDKSLLDSDNCYVDCVLTAVTAEGVDIGDSVFVSCKFADVDLYWCQAFRSVFIDCAFESCDLRGNFDEATFLRCRFTACEYGDDNLGGKTYWEQATAVGCAVSGPPLPLTAENG